MLARLVPILNGIAHYGNPLHIAIRRWLARPGGSITIVDRRTNIKVVTSVEAYHMFGETWYTGDYDVAECAIREGDVVVDIGAHQGFFTCYAASRGAVVYAFEPYPPSFARLTENVAENGLTGRVHAFPEAVSNHTSVTQMRCFNYLGGGSNTIVNSHVPDLKADEQVNVPTIDIATALDRVPGQIRLCKLDCEGAELDIVKAIASPTRIDSLALEYHPYAYQLHDLVAVLTSWGTHQVSFSRTGNMLYAVSNKCLQDYASRWY